MSKNSLTFTLARSDGHVTRVSGKCGFAVMLEVDLPSIADTATVAEVMAALEEMPTVMLRCDNSMQLAICLGTLLGAVLKNCPSAMPVALAIADMVDMDKLVLERELP